MKKEKQFSNRQQRCIGYGIYKGKCDNEAGTPWGPHWCLRCTKLDWREYLGN